MSVLLGLATNALSRSQIGTGDRLRKLFCFKFSSQEWFTPNKEHDFLLPSKPEAKLQDRKNLYLIVEIDSFSVINFTLSL